MEQWRKYPESKPTLIHHMHYEGDPEGFSYSDNVLTVSRYDGKISFGIGCYTVEPDTGKEYFVGITEQEIDLYNCNVIAWQPLPPLPEV